MTDEERALRDEFLGLCQARADGLCNERLKQHFGDRSAQLVAIINTLLKENRIMVLTSNTNELVFQAVDPVLAERMKDLGVEQMLVYQVILKAGNKGLWHKDIRDQTSLLQPELKKILKNLEPRKLIKNTSSKASKTRKLYMLYNLEPAKEITGGPWYTDHDCDYEFIEQLSRAVYRYIRKEKKPPSFKQIADHVRTSGVSKLELTPDNWKQGDGDRGRSRVISGSAGGGMLTPGPPAKSGSGALRS